MLTNKVNHKYHELYSFTSQLPFFFFLIPESWILLLNPCDFFSNECHSKVIGKRTFTKSQKIRANEAERYRDHAS